MGFLGGFNLIKLKSESKRKVQFGWSWQQMKSLTEYYHIKLFQMIWGDQKCQKGNLTFWLLLMGFIVLVIVPLVILKILFTVQKRRYSRAPHFRNLLVSPKVGAHVAKCDKVKWCVYCYGKPQADAPLQTKKVACFLISSLSKYDLNDNHKQLKI